MPRATPSTDLDHCPACGLKRIDEGRASAAAYRDGIWIGCTACGFSVSGPDPATIRAAWKACCRDTRLREMRLA